MATRLRAGASSHLPRANDSDCRPSFLCDSIGAPSLEKHIAEVGAMNLRVAHGAGLILRRLIVRGSAWPPGRNWVEKVWHCRQSMLTGSR